MLVYQRVIFYFSHISAQKTDKVLTALIALGSVAQAKVSLVVGHAARAWDRTPTLEEISVNRKNLNERDLGKEFPYQTIYCT